MPICRIQIENFKSIKKCDLTMDELTLLIGENGTGKTNVLQAISYFYNNLTSANPLQNIFDENNQLCNSIKIKISYDFSRLSRIARNQLHRYPDETQYLNYYKKIDSFARAGKKFIYTVELEQIKELGIKWSINHTDRLVIASLFPLYFLECREINVNDWDRLWRVIGDLNKLPNNKRTEIQATIKSDIDNLEASINSRKINTLMGVLEKSGVNLKKYNNKEFSSEITKIYSIGERFQKSDKHLGYYSTGTNSVNYIVLYMEILALLSKFKLKEPLLILDEPEINLHHKFIDYLSENISQVAGNIHILIATHSARFTKNALKSDISYRIYKLRLEKKYTQIVTMKLFDDLKESKQKYLITDEHANAYFSQALLLVEGASEIEVFSNPYLRNLYPKLKFLDTYEAMSDDNDLKMVSPAERMTGIPYLYIVDMDKCFDYDRSKDKLFLKKYLNNPLEKNEKMVFYSKCNHRRQNGYLLRRRILAMFTKCKFSYDQTWYNSQDGNYHEFKQIIKQYLLEHHIFACDTTIEGTLVNEKNTAYVLDYVKQKRKQKYSGFESFYLGLANPSYKINMLRMLFEGKSDLLVKLKNTNISNSDKNIIQCMIFQKQSGWITEFLECFFLKLLEEQGVSCNNFKEAEKALNDFQTRQKVRASFEEHFEELAKILGLCCSMVTDIL